MRKIKYILSKINRFFIRPYKKLILSKIEKRVLKFKLYDWQRNFILYDNKVMPREVLNKRASGKTLAWDLSIILWAPKHKCIIIKTEDSILHDEPSMLGKSSYRSWHQHELQDLYTKIIEAKIPIGKIEFRK